MLMPKIFNQFGAFTIQFKYLWGYLPIVKDESNEHLRAMN